MGAICRGSTVKSSADRLGVVVGAMSDRGSPSRTPVVWDGSGFVSLVPTCNITLISRPSQGQRLEAADYDDLDDGDSYYRQFEKGRGLALGDYCLVDAEPQEPSVAEAKKVVYKAVKAQVDEIGAQLTTLENEHTSLDELRMSLASALVVINTAKED